VLACLLLLALILLGIGVVARSGWFQSLDRNLSEPPPRASSQLEPQVPVSQLAVNVTLPFEHLAQTAEAATPRTYAGSGTGPDACASIGVRVCVGTRYDFNATRGPVRFAAGPGNSIRISMPLQVTGNGGLRGSGARLLHMDAKRFDASTDARADVTLNLQPNWCPRVQVSVDFTNLDARIEIVKDAWIGVSQLIAGSVREQVHKMGERAASVLTCESVRKAVQEVWTTRSVPLVLPEDPRPLYVNVEPLSIGFSGVTVSSSAAKFLLGLAVRASVSDTAMVAEKRPLPAWNAVSERPGALQLAVPLRISYEGLAAHLETTLAGKPYSLRSPLGATTVTVDKVTVYPAGERIAVGAHIKAVLPVHVLATRGWLYLTARPVVSPDGRAVHLADIGYSRILDSTLARFLTVLLDGEIRERLAAAGQLDLTERIAKAKELLKSGLAKHSGPLSVELGEEDLRLGRIVPGRDDLFVEGLFTSGAEVVLVGTR